MEYYAYYIIPLISAIIGYVTNVVAIKMTFYPLEYKGIRPFLGWQGIIPSKSDKMAEIAVDLLTRDLFKPRDVFARLDIAEVVRLSFKDFSQMSQQIADSVLDSRVPLSGTILGRKVKPAVQQAVSSILPGVVKHAMLTIQQPIDDILDLKSLAKSMLREDKSLINKIFLDLGGKQFRFLEVSGLWLGLIFGIGQIFTAMYVSHWIMYVAYGMFIGYITNFLAIKMIFEPTEPVQIGPLRLWGLFLKNQREASYKYADIIANRILTSENLFDCIFRDPSNPHTRRIMQQEVSVAVDHIVDTMPAMVKLVLTNQKIQELKAVTLFNLMHELPLHIGVIYPYAEKTLDVRNSIGDQMSKLPPSQFVEFLRPAFREDEWKLVAVGTALGGVAGFLQSFI
ncbi:MAG: hypothetical protein MJZ61_01465 [Bacteroidales bacterium]|nr:hypothetical protein [Bacteroidales bacterium]